nr:MAG TPA: hypothetical protein [Caudoviricetes sp.]
MQKPNRSPNGVLRFGLQLTRSKGSCDIELCRRMPLSHQ